MNTMKIFANYGVLSAEKLTVYTAGNPANNSATSEEITVAIPEGFQLHLSNSGESLITLPSGVVYTANELLSATEDGAPAFHWLDTNQARHTVKLQVQ